jgi:GDP-L-fucose synthase
MEKNIKIFIAGHNGLVGSACWSLLESLGYSNLIGRSSKELDLRNQLEVDKFIRDEKPYAIIDAAAKVGGILANATKPYEFLMDNMLIQNNLIGSAHRYNVEKFIFLGSSCIYPKFATQPIKEEYLMTDTLEPTNEWYAIAKISGVKLIESLRKEYGRDYVSLMPTNLYGPKDNFDLTSSHVLPAMLRKFHEAKVEGDRPVELWGTGDPMREFLHVNDLASAVVYVLENRLDEHLYNVGFGDDVTIKDLAKIIQSVVNHKGSIIWDLSKPDGTPKKLLDSSKLISSGWSPTIGLKEGIESTYRWFLNSYGEVKSVTM